MLHSKYYHSILQMKKKKKKKTKTPNPSSPERLSNLAWGGPVNKRQNWDSNPDSETGREFKEAPGRVQTQLWVTQVSQESVKEGLVIDEGLVVDPGSSGARIGRKDCFGG